MDPGTLGDGVALEVEVLGEGLADEEDAGRVQAHGLLQAGLQVGQLRQIPRGKRVCTVRIQLLQICQPCSGHTVGAGRLTQLQVPSLSADWGQQVVQVQRRSKPMRKLMRSGDLTRTPHLDQLVHLCRTPGETVHSESQG